MPRPSKANLAGLARACSEKLQSLPAYFNLLKDSELALTDQHPRPDKIQKHLVHKQAEKNVLISLPYRTGNLYWFNLFEQSGEFQFDHPSDHLQGMLLIEGLRQASIASIHLSGLPRAGSIALLSFEIDFISYADSSYPLLIRSFTHFCPPQPNQKESFVLVVPQVFQKGRLCVQARLTGYLFWSPEEATAARQRTQAISQRQQQRFEQML